LPVHPHQFPARIFHTGPGDQVVRFLAHHGGAPDGGQICSSIELMGEL
jgi:hypothetical protein